MRSGGPIAKTVEEYLARVPEPARTTLEKVRATIRAAAPREATESISYGMPMFKYKGVLVGYAAFTSHCGLYPGASPLVTFREELKGYETSKGTIRFAQDKPFPAALLKKIVKARVAENESKKGR
jgi:uncharacterized protein YdhG (YjbR/CyaY superfamily)